MQKGGAVRTYANIQRLAEQAETNKERVRILIQSVNNVNLNRQTDEELVEFLRQINDLHARITERLERVNEVKRDRDRITRIDQEMREKRIRTARPDTILDSLIQQYNEANQQITRLQQLVMTEQGTRAERLRQERIAAERLEAERRREELRAAERARIEAQRVIAEQEFENRLQEIRDATDEEIIARFPQFDNRWMLMQRRLRATIRERLDQDDGRLAVQFEEFRAARRREVLNRARAAARRAAAIELNNNNNNNNNTAVRRPPTQHLPIPTEPWTGFTRGDIENLNSVFDTSGMLVGYKMVSGTTKKILNSTGKPIPIYGRPVRESTAVCPVCLTFLPRESGCFYIQGHNCRTLAETNGSGLYHHELYDKYKDDNGNIISCSICSRICQNAPESHLKLVKHDAPRAKRTGMTSDSFGDEANCIESGGGGFKEKIIRYNALRAKALELNTQVGKITKYDAYKQLVEALWDAPLNPPTTLNTTKFEIPNINFPSIINTSKTDTRRIIPRLGYRLPTIELEGENAFGMDDPPLIRFHHLSRAGSMNDHDSFLISLSGLMGWLESSTENPTQIFTCPDNVNCKGFVYPEELESLLNQTDLEFTDDQKKFIINYRRRFNESFKFEDEDESEGLFHPADDAQCRSGGGAGHHIGGYRQRLMRHSKRIQRRNRNRRKTRK